MASRRPKTEKRVSVPNLRFIALVSAAAWRGCSCAAPETRVHDGKCISCWALVTRLESLRKSAASPFRSDSSEVRSSAAWLFQHRIEECEKELRFRAEGLPAAERRLAEARKKDEASRG